MQVPGMFHQDFSDALLLSPISSRSGLTGSLDPQRAHQIVTAYALAFFRPAPEGPAGGAAGGAGGGVP
ncbi:hypothetical protein LIP_0909 [Limnochorda pilosa]|uniref:Uncharacterized protein n=1 Tax=Limnochorda pilosa TaxID=1555112 RepID=A0A0K2SI14_LIMPI|nr:hypothetical protein LIP_0909 [Limnochorda pilosa]